MVDGVEIAILKILPSPPVKLVRSTLDGLVELAAGGVAELGRELVLQHGEIVYRIVGNRHQRTSDRLVVVIHSLDGKIIVARSLTGNGRSSPHRHPTAGSYARVQQ